MTESNLRKILRDIIKEETHLFHGFKDQKALKDTGLPGPEFSNDTSAATDEEIADTWIEEHSPDELVAYSRGAAVTQELDDETYSKIGKMVYVAPAAKRKWTNKSVKSAPSGSEMWADSLDSLVPLRQACQIADEAGIDTVKVWHDKSAREKVGQEREGKYEKDGSVKKVKWYGLGIPAHQQAVRKYAKNLAPSMELPVADCLSAAELKDWGKSGVGSNEDVEAQYSWVEEKLGESAIRKLVRSILLEAKAKREVKCPLLPNGKRDYKCEYRKYGGADKKNKLERAARNRARKKAEKMGLVRKGDGMELDHIKPLSLGGSNDQTNWQVMSRKDNRRKGKKWNGKSGS